MQEQAGKTVTRRVYCRLALWILGLGIGWTSIVAGRAQFPIAISVEERAGVGPRLEYVEGGIPFPKGLVRDIGELRVEEGRGMAVPAQFEVLSRWPNDGSLRWVFVTFASASAANARKSYHLTRGANVRSKGEVKVTREANRIWIDTGAVRFAVRTGKGFNIIDEAHVLNWQVLGPSDRGLYMDMDGALFSTVHDAKPEVVVERNGPLAVTVKAEGRMATSAGQQGFHYIVRIHAYAGFDRVRIEPTILRLYGSRNQTSAVKEFGLELRLAGDLGRQYMIGTHAATAQGPLQPGQEAGVRCHSSDRYELFGAASGGGPAKSVKPLTLGWIGANSANVAVTAGVRHFWEMHPKALLVRAPATPEGGGRLIIRLLDGTAKPFDFIAGMARTHEVLLGFPVDGRANLAPVFAAHQRPLRLWPTAEWLTRAGVFYGPLAPRDSPHAQTLAAWDRQMDDYLQQMLAERDRWEKRGVSMDAYGFLAFGDLPHWVWDEEPKNSPWAIAWNSQYYDLPLLMALLWARGGSPQYFDYFEVASRHLADVHVLHYHDGFPLHAGTRRCPATNHVGFDPPNHRQAVGSFNLDHHKTESLFLRYYLLGDRWALRVAMGQAEYAFQHKDAAFNRNIANQMNTLLAAWAHTGESRWIERANKLVEAMAAQEKAGWPKGDWWSGLILEAMAKHHWTTGDERSKRVLVSYARHLNAQKYRFPNCAFAYAYVGRLEKDEGLVNAAMDCLKEGRVDHLSKDVPRLYRSVPYLGGVLGGSR